jgi:hypothetical protein
MCVRCHGDAIRIFGYYEIIWPVPVAERSEAKALITC